MFDTSSRALFARLIAAEGQGRAAWSVEVFGWLILFEGTVMLFAPHFVAALLHMPEFVGQGADYFRVMGMLTGGLGMLYVASGRLNAREFVFASMLDRPLVPLLVGVLWYLGIIPGTLALAFAVQDFGSFMWTLSAWRSQAPSDA
jgi:hypothetical protein